jgi:hypothetical protein
MPLSVETVKSARSSSLTLAIERIAYREPSSSLLPTTRLVAVLTTATTPPEMVIKYTVFVENTTNDEIEVRSAMMVAGLSDGYGKIVVPESVLI